jgi:hypothetical protein
MARLGLVHFSNVPTGDGAERFHISCTYQNQSHMPTEHNSTPVLRNLEIGR